MSWMSRRNWREKLAKSKSGQSLFEHTLIELDVLLQLVPLLRDPKHYGLAALEESILAVAILVHDAGKETDDWQTFVKNSGIVPWVSHILPDLSDQLVPEICEALGMADLSSAVHRVIVNCAGIHHDRPGRSDAAVIEAMLTGASDRFLTLANLLKAIDHLCSANSPSEAVSTGTSDAGLQRHIKLTAYELIPRGVSTTLLHLSAQRSFQEAGWNPLLYFANGTVYFADLNLPATAPPAETVGGALKAELETALKREVASLVVGSPTGNILPKPDLLAYSEIREYLTRAGNKIGPQSFARKKLEDRRKVVAKYLRPSGGADAISPDEVERQSGRISAAQPEMLVFKFFKALMDPGKVPSVGEDGLRLAREKYEAIFGSGSWDQLQSTSTLMPAKDMAATVDRYWVLHGQSVGHPQVPLDEQLPDEKRLATLVGVLTEIARTVFEAVKRPAPRDTLAGDMASSFISDLLTPAGGQNPRALAQRQFENYSQSKPNAGKELSGSLYLCPICSRPFDRTSGQKASADFIANPETHTNRGVSHGGFGSVMICSACYHERVLRQLLMGQPLAEFIAMSPRLNLGPSNGAALVRKVREWADAANGTLGAESGFSMSLTDQTARVVRGRDPFGMNPEELLGLFRYRLAPDTQKKRRRAVLEALQDAFDNDLTSLEDIAGKSFDDWDAAVQDLIDDKIDQQDCKAIRRSVMKLGDAIELIPQSPNLIMIPLRYEIASGKDESQTSRGLRRLYVALILSVAFDAAVSIRRVDEIANPAETSGAAHVPAIPALRSLVGKEWIDVADARHWINAIGAASILARDADLPPRSGLYQALTADPAEMLVRRIEMNGRSVSTLQLDLISQLPEFHTGAGQRVIQ
jgi:hypothetical protein